MLLVGFYNYNQLYSAVSNNETRKEKKKVAFIHIETPLAFKKIQSLYSVEQELVTWQGSRILYQPFYCPHNHLDKEQYQSANPH